MADLIIIHGPPASGKLTIARELSQIIDAQVFHNHLTIDVAQTLFDFGSSHFWDLVHDLRIRSLESFFNHGARYLITTWCYEDPEDFELYQTYSNIASSANGRVLPVFLDCDVASLEARIADEHRGKMGKLTDVNRLREILANKNYSAIPDELCLKINSSITCSKASAEKIVAEFSL